VRGELWTFLASGEVKVNAMISATEEIEQLQVEAERWSADEILRWGCPGFIPKWRWPLALVRRVSC